MRWYMALGILRVLDVRSPKLESNMAVGCRISEYQRSLHEPPSLFMCPDVLTSKDFQGFRPFVPLRRWLAEFHLYQLRGAMWKDSLGKMKICYSQRTVRKLTQNWQGRF